MIVISIFINICALKRFHRQFSHKEFYLHKKMPHYRVYFVDICKVHRKMSVETFFIRHFIRIKRVVGNLVNVCDKYIWLDSTSSASVPAKVQWMYCQFLISKTTVEMLTFIRKVSNSNWEPKYQINLKFDNKSTSYQTGYFLLFTDYCCQLYLSDRQQLKHHTIVMAKQNLFVCMVASNHSLSLYPWQKSRRMSALLYWME